MNYTESVRPYKVNNVYSQLQTPTLVRVDINLPVKDGEIVEDAMRMEVYADVLDLYSTYAGLVVMGHQGRKGDDDFTSFKPHYRHLLKKLPSDIDLDFVTYDKIFDKNFTEETLQKIADLKTRQIILLDNVRYFEHETEFDQNTSPYIPFFKGVIKTCVNDAIPVWHRANSSLMCLPYIAQTYIGMRSFNELGIIERIRASKEKKALICGGKKLQKVSDLKKIYESGVKVFTGGLVGQIIARVKGHDLGEMNNKFLEENFSQQEFNDSKVVASFKEVRYPEDFTVWYDGKSENISLKGMGKSKGLIMDIGENTVDKYAKELQESEIRIRTGPLGVYEKGFKHGTELTERITGDGLIFLGGDTSQELVSNGLHRRIINTGGQILLSGGAALHRLANGSFPSIDLILSMYGD